MVNAPAGAIASVAYGSRHNDGRRADACRVLRGRCSPHRAAWEFFSTLLKCDVCGSSFVLSDRSHYACASMVNGHRQFCGNRGRVRRTTPEAALLRDIKEKLASPEAVRAICAHAAPGRACQARPITIPSDRRARGSKRGSSSPLSRWADRLIFRQGSRATGWNWIDSLLRRARR